MQFSPKGKLFIRRDSHEQLCWRPPMFTTFLEKHAGISQTYLRHCEYAFRANRQFPNVDASATSCKRSPRARLRPRAVRAAKGAGFD